MDMDFEQRNEVSEAEYMEMIRLKTSVLLGCALQMGGIVGGANPKDAKLLYTFGEQLGLAFQIQDDLLDLYGQSAEVGKQIGGDVLANKKTLLSISAKQAANPTQLALLQQLEQTLDPDLKVLQTQELYTVLGAQHYCAQQMQLHHQKALNSLEQLENVGSKIELTELAEFLFSRTN
jgi:geranylgeranyl diphosphate synthase type II